MWVACLAGVWAGDPKERTRGLGPGAVSYSVGHDVRSCGATQMFLVTSCLSFPSQLSLLSSSVVSGGSQSQELPLC